MGMRETTFLNWYCLSRQPEARNGWGCFSLNELWLSLLLVYGKNLKINSLGALEALFKHVSTSTRGRRLDPLEKEIQELSCFGFKLSANVVF